MKVELKFWHGLVLMGVLAIFFKIQGCNSDRKYENEVEKNLRYKDTVMTYQAQDGTLVNFNEALETRLDAFFEVQGDSVKNYLRNIKIPKPDVVTVYSERFYVDSIPQVSLGLTNCDFDTTFTLDNPWYNINGRVTDEALKINSITIPNKATIVVGDSKQKWWKRKEYIVTIDNTNPYIQTQGIQSYTFKEKQSRLSIGPSIGYGFYYDPWKGNVGHGITGSISLNYRLFGWKKK